MTELKPPEPPRRSQPIYHEVLGRAIKVVRTEQGIERRELAERAGISYSYLAEIENGNKPPSSDVLLAICQALGLRPSELHAAADSLPDRTMWESRSSLRQANIAASAERSWPGQTVQSRMAMKAQPDTPRATPTPTSVDRQAILQELMRMLERTSDDDLQMVLQMARRLGKR